MDVDGLIGLLGSGEACSEFELSVIVRVRVD